MAVGQLPDQVREFARYLRDLVGRLDQGAGWCGVFWQRDPDGMRACLDGAEVPPWDVVQALLHDLAADRGVPEAERETGRARALHRASLDAYDARPGGRELLSDRLDMMLREQRVALERQAELSQQLASAAHADDVDRLNLDLAWVRDDQERATARCVELQERMDRLTEAARPSWVDLGGGAGSADVFGGGPVSPADAHGLAGEYVPGGEHTPTSAHGFDPVPAHGDPGGGAGVPRQGVGPGVSTERAERSRRRPRGARFAGPADTGGQGEGAGGQGAASAPASARAPEVPRGARYAPTAWPTPAPHVTEAEAGTEARSEPGTEADADARATSDAVRDLIRLRGEGRSGEAHGVLVEAAAWPASRLPLFAGELHRAGLGADWATLLWEAASLPPDRLVALADALAGAGRGEDCRKLLRQGVARPAPEIAEAILALMDADREREARALLDSYLRVRTPEDVARCAHTDPHRLIPVLLETAKAVSDEHHWDLVHALRVAGFSA
ncbi:hypothetical protein ACFVYR_03300 [Streptomyces sp. NPDC058284]|uniref:hypothetical protein n=1 Tax=unclassified Streptomyces TaxID=2593676 RepID=UPI003648C6A7